MHNTSHEFGFVDITIRRSLKVISEISPPRPASSSASSWKIAVEFYGGWRISSYFVKMTLFHSPKTMELILVVVISAGMAENSQNGVSGSLNKRVKWAEKWQMLFNKDKCKCLHIGQANAKKNYLMNNTVLLSKEREKDVGVVVSSDMKVSEQCGIAARKGNQILGLIRRNIAYRDKRLIIPLYISLVRPHLEYCIQAWRPHVRKDIDKLERVQRRATRLISEISQLSYEERLQQCRLTTLETRRIRGDQIEVLKIMHGYEGLNKDMFFRIKNDSITRGHSLALVKSHSRLDIRKYTFSQRVVNDWNKLPEECINATSVNMFKNKIDQYYLKTRRE